MSLRSVSAITPFGGSERVDHSASLMVNEVRRLKVEAALLPASAANDGGQRSIAGRRTNVSIGFLIKPN